MNKFGNFMIGLGLVVALVVTLGIWVRLPWPAVLGLAVLFALWMALTRQGRQASSVTAVGVSTLRQRLGCDADTSSRRASPSIITGERVGFSGKAAIRSASG